MNNKELLYKKLNALRLEVDSSIVDDIKSTVDALFQEQNLQQTDVSGSASPIGEPKQIADWKTKAEKWEALGKQIEKFYCNSEGDYDEENPEEEGDLIAIGEVAACAYGWL